MPDSEIQLLERMTDAEVAAYIMREGTAKAGENIVCLMRSYRIASRVANAAWKAVKEGETGVFTDSYDELRKTLNLYSPGNFPPYASDLEFGCRLLEELYDHLSPLSGEGMTTMVLMEKLFERIEQLRGLLLPGGPVLGKS
jgi:hypothetical protein